MVESIVLERSAWFSSFCENKVGDFLSSCLHTVQDLFSNTLCEGVRSTKYSKDVYDGLSISLQALNSKMADNLVMKSAIIVFKDLAEPGIEALYNVWSKGAQMCESFHVTGVASRSEVVSQCYSGAFDARLLSLKCNKIFIDYVIPAFPKAVVCPSSALPSISLLLGGVAVAGATTLAIKNLWDQSPIRALGWGVAAGAAFAVSSYMQ
jgi:hypothetical protein